MKLKIIAEDGSIQGWFVSGLLTLSRLVCLIASYFSSHALTVEQAIGASYTAFVLTSVGSWFGYKLIKGKEVAP